MVERALSAAPTPSSVLPGFWLLSADEKLGPTLRLSRDEAGQSLYETEADQIRQLKAELARRQG